MILLDTNVISEFMRETPERAVVAWLDNQPTGSSWTTSITVFEIEFGLQRMPDGRRRRGLLKAFHEFVEDELESRVIPFDTVAARQAGALAARLESGGRRLEIRDLQISGIALAHAARVATRNVRHFAQACEVVNPWA